MTEVVKWRRHILSSRREPQSIGQEGNEIRLQEGLLGIDALVKNLVMHGLRDRHIAKFIAVPGKDVSESVHRLVKAETLSIEQVGHIRGRKEEVIVLAQKVKILVDNGLNNQEISKEIGQPYSRICSSVKWMAKEGFVDTGSNLVTRVLEFKKQGLRSNEIAEILGETYYRIKYIEEKLRKANQIPKLPRYKPESKHRIGEVRSKLKTRLIKHMEQNPNLPINLSELAGLLGVGRERTRQLYRKISAEIQVPALKYPKGNNR